MKEKIFWAVHHLELLNNNVVDDTTFLFTTYEDAQKFFVKTKKRALHYSIDNDYEIKSNGDNYAYMENKDKGALIEIRLDTIKVDDTLE